MAKLCRLAGHVGWSNHRWKLACWNFLNFLFIKLFRWRRFSLFLILTLFRYDVKMVFSQMRTSWWGGKVRAKLANKDQLLLDRYGIVAKLEWSLYNKFAAEKTGSSNIVDAQQDLAGSPEIYRKQFTTRDLFLQTISSQVNSTLANFPRK
jgi:hypothetical protein